MATVLTTESIPYLVLLVIILAGNVYVCYLYFSTRSLRNVTNKLVLSSAIGDILIAVVFIPFYVVIDKGISGYVASFSAFCSLFNLAALTYDRSVAIFKGLRYIEIMQTGKVHLIIVMVWFVSLVICLVPLSWEYSLTGKHHKLASTIYQAILTVLLIIINFVIFAVYVRIFKVNRYHLAVAHKQNSAVSKSYVDDKASSENLELSLMNQRRDGNNFMDLFVIRREPRPQPKKKATNARTVSLIAEIKAAKVIAAIFTINCVCWLPVIIINVCDVTSPGGTALYIPVEFVDASRYFFVINSAVNPFIYAFCKKDFRKVIRRKFRACGFK